MSLSGKQKILHKTKTLNSHHKNRRKQSTKDNQIQQCLSLQHSVAIKPQKIKNKNVQVKIQCHCNTVRLLFTLSFTEILRVWTRPPLAEPRRRHPLRLSVQFIY